MTQLMDESTQRSLYEPYHHHENWRHPSQGQHCLQCWCGTALQADQVSASTTIESRAQLACQFLLIASRGLLDLHDLSQQGYLPMDSRTTTATTAHAKDFVAPVSLDVPYHPEEVLSEVEVERLSEKVQPSDVCIKPSLHVWVYHHPPPSDPTHCQVEISRQLGSSLHVSVINWSQIQQDSRKLITELQCQVPSC